MNQDFAPRTVPSETELATAAVAPRVTMDQVLGSIASEHYFTAQEGDLGAKLNDDQNSTPCPIALGLLTFCVLVLANGFTVVGQSACASPENFDAETGKRFARKDAEGKIWPLLGYELRTKLAAPFANPGVPVDDGQMSREDD